jgi:protease I
MPYPDLNVAVLARDNYQELELWFPLLRYREVGAAASLIGRAAVEHLGGVGYPAIPDQIVGESAVPAVLIIPGRAPAPAGAELAEDELTAGERDLLHAVRDAGGVLAAIGDGVAVLGAAGLLEGHTVASNDATAAHLAGFGATRATGTVHTDSAIVTAAGADDLPEFVTAIDAAALATT